jgi:hypothetical protein
MKEGLRLFSKRFPTRLLFPDPFSLPDPFSFPPETKSDQDGNFELKFVRPGDVLVQVEPFYMRSSDGHMSAIDSAPVTIGENETKSP